MLRFETYFCCLLNGYSIFCSYVLLSELNSHLTRNDTEMNESFSYYKVEKHKNICHLQRKACNTLVNK